MILLLLDSFYQTNLSDFTVQTYSRVDDFITSLCIITTSFAHHHRFADDFRRDEAATRHFGYRNIFHPVRCGGVRARSTLAVNLNMGG